MKKQERLENKKRKLVALAKIVEINETDKAMKNELTRDVDSKTSENMVNKFKKICSRLKINQFLFNFSWESLYKKSKN